MSILARVIMLTMVTIALGVSAAQEDREKNTSEAQRAATAPSAAAKTPVEPAPSTAQPEANKNPPATESPERFEPTEKVRADFDVSFPVDI